MKYKSLLLFVLSAPLILLASCQKNASPLAPSEPQEIVLSLGGDNLALDVKTKTTALSSLPSSLYLMMKNGTATKMNSTSMPVSSGKIATGLYQTTTPTSYSYYLSNVAITAGSSANTGTISAANDTDVIAGYSTNSTTSPSVTMEHIFSRTGSLSLTAPSGYTISGISYKISSSAANTGTKGTYSISNKTWSSTTLLSTATALTSSSDLYLIPGEYTIACTYTLTKGDYSETFTKNATVTLVAGKTCNISGVAPTGNAQSISLSVTLTPWSSQSVTMTF